MTSTKLNTLIIGIFLFFSAQINAQQAKENLAKDFPFFQNKGIEYGKWLDKTGLGKLLIFDKVRMRPMRTKPGIDSTELEIFLLLRTNDPDSAVGMWESLKRGFDTSEDSLENYLYRTLAHKMEIPGEQGSIQVYIKDKDGQYNPCFYIFIWQELDKAVGHKILSEYHYRGCRAKSFEITVQSPAVKTTGKGKSAKVIKPKVKTANQVFDIIRKYAVDSIIQQPRYRRAECNDRKPRFEADSVRTANSFRFTLADLGREVLTNQYRSSWEQFWGYNTIAMERLTFEFEYYPIQGGFILKCVIDGKYGSGVFKPRTAGYMNMEPDFDDFFESYKNKFRQEIQKRL